MKRKRVKRKRVKRKRVKRKRMKRKIVKKKRLEKKKAKKTRKKAKPKPYLFKKLKYNKSSSIIFSSPPPKPLHPSPFFPPYRCLSIRIVNITAIIIRRHAMHLIGRADFWCSSAFSS